MVQSVYVPEPLGFDVEIVDLDTRDPEEEEIELNRLQIIEQSLYKIY